MLNPQVDSLRSRWDTMVLNKTNAALSQGVTLSPFPRLDSGRADMRGLQLNAFVRHVAVENVDFSYMRSELTGRFDWCTIRNCCFKAAELVGHIGTEIDDCNFTGATFGRVGKVVLNGSFIGCCFDKADMTSVLGDQVRFVRCTFKGTKMRRAQLTHCLFDHCDFTDVVLASGSFAYSRFIGCGIPKELRRKTLMERIVEEDTC